MKLKMHSFDFEECTLTFSVPKDIMHNNSFGNVRGGVEIDLVAITGNAALKTVEAGQPAHNSRARDEICPSCGSRAVVIKHTPSFQCTNVNCQRAGKLSPEADLYGGEES
jgi:hypothetical protein